MKNIFIKALAGVALTMSVTACGDKFLETPIYNAVDIDTGLSTPNSIGYALNGAYYRLSQYYFAGTYSVFMGDVISDLAYWNGSTGHWNSMYTCTYLDTDTYLSYMWQIGYKVVDNSARVIKACNELIPEVNSDEAAQLRRYVAEAHALRGYAMFVMTNIYAHQIKVDGQDFSNEPGIVVVDEPVEAYSEVSRSSVGECYAQIVADLNASLTAFDEAGSWSRSGEVFTPAAVYGLMARVKLYMEDWVGARDAAARAISISGITELATDEDSYESLYASQWSNDESLFFLALDNKTNWSANSLGTLWTTYCFSPTPYLVSLYEDTDVRASIMKWTSNDGKKYAAYGATVPYYGGGKYGVGSFNGVEGGNPAVQTNYLINAPEMFLIQAEANLKLGDEAAAKNALLTVAKRNTAITSVGDLPSGAANVMSFIRDERARELFQEGHRLWDLRRWNVNTNLYATQSPKVNYSIKNVQLGNLTLPIPQSEIESGFGVQQTPNWDATRPR